MERVFVYGTLRKGLPLHFHMTNETFIGNAELSGYTLFWWAYPAIIAGASNGYTVKGEVYEISPERLARLDSCERYQEGDQDSLYLRERVKVELFDGSTVSAWVYVVGRDGREAIRDFPEKFPVVKSGDFVEYYNNL